MPRGSAPSRGYHSRSLRARRPRPGGRLLPAERRTTGTTRQYASAPRRSPSTPLVAAARYSSPDLVGSSRPFFRIPDRTRDVRSKLSGPVAELNDPGTQARSPLPTQSACGSTRRSLRRARRRHHRLGRLGDATELNIEVEHRRPLLYLSSEQRLYSEP